MTSALSFDALPALPQKTALTALAQRLWDQGEVVALWLGGSFARGAADLYSDVDLRVAVRPEALASWERPDFDLLFGGSCVGHQFLSFGTDVFLHHLVLSSGDIFDLWIQSSEQDPPQDSTLVLGCRDALFARRLEDAAICPAVQPAPAEPQCIRQAIVDFWIGSLKHRKVLHRGLVLLAPTGIHLERAVLLRLWYVQATGEDTGALRPTIHTLTHTAHVVEREMARRALEMLGAPLTNRVQIVAAIERHRDEVSRVGTLLAQAMGFEYPETLEETVRNTWQNYLA